MGVSTFEHELRENRISLIINIEKLRPLVAVVRKTDRITINWNARARGRLKLT